MAVAPIFDLSGRTALVTVASSGIGARFARILAASGANVVVAARRADRLAALCSEIESAGGRAIAVSLDVADEASTIAAYDAAEKAFGTVDTIIANAGVNSEGLVTDIPADEFDQTVAVNLRGVFLTVREGARRLIAAGSAQKENGRVIITASITADVVSPGLGVYSATKAGVIQFGKVMAREWVRKGINVNMICPGYIKTELTADWFESEGGAQQVAAFNRRRLMQESDLDVPLLFLSSDAARGVTGTTMTIDDGQSF
ncbi:NAD(P)-dependent dehydrogenase (short-subunit alcohol dehydrogenase family) [Novosphingobium hassiacum]|uniref:NAD(P)-dependent dehydrogenase (Short-subunit alcohol dehydrogenase family) n=1 Tax=Novosphingobium hassiacum TaxID=173676 RepID=A0A7W5ZX27_9SPHN|nr:SDR family NAD(P)-dependent oxidoreductase [Novosphingobium hassiacum]MBB3860922.1 NAD(P)-dependent dehydrogenase (short-subunit alcohol dehydrogenase family) [Novosphingobium hassiacum]